MNMSESVYRTGATAASRRPAKGKWIAGGVLLLSAVLIVQNLPHGYSDDLSRIGNGKVAVVLVRDKSAVQSFDLLEVMDAVRDRNAGQVEFLLTDFDTPEGRAFIAGKGAVRVTLDVFDGRGKLLEVLSPPQTVEHVQQAIDKASGGVS
jgi:hypothetical protein